MSGPWAAVTYGVLTMTLASGCNESLLADRFFACVDDAECVAGFVCRNDATLGERTCQSIDADGPTCTDGVHNRDETDIDCGGSCGGCPTGGVCIVPGDCAVAPCLAGVCVDPATCEQEICDGEDNDCDGETDEDFAFNSAPIGAECEGTGACGQGVVECAADGVASEDGGVCSTNPDGSAPEHVTELCDTADSDCNGVIDDIAATEGICRTEGVCDSESATASVSCLNGLPTLRCDYAGIEDYEPRYELSCDGQDNDCDGDTDEGCTGDVSDLDGDGQSPPEDCNDLDAGVFSDVGRNEPCCPDDIADQRTCDINCDGHVVFCGAGDADGDGFTRVGGDCDDHEPRIYPGAPERCDDAIDSNCNAGDDRPCETHGDADADGFDALVDCDDNDSSIHPGRLEVCDGVDQDCDGDTDEGNPEGGGDCGRQGGACFPGREACVNTDTIQGEIDCVGDLGPSVERCDGTDNDCDGVIDEDYSFDSGAIGETCSGTDSCPRGIVACASPSETECLTQDEPSIEMCDGLDNDCDGTTDNNIVGSPEDICPSLGVCEGRTIEASLFCVAGGWVCEYPTISNFETTETLCDGLDNDCDGTVDEELGLAEACDGDDADRCATGTPTCDPQDPSRTLCAETGESNLVERCDGADNDCDGLVDETFGLLGLPCDGDDAFACADGVLVCDAAQLGPYCLEDGARGAAEVCDGLDNDCNGRVDDALMCTCTDGDERVCGSNTGVCTTGTQSCQAGLWTPCSGAEGGAEVCDLEQRDENCDGTVNEGCECVPMTEETCAHLLGFCAFGTRACGSDGRWGACSIAPRTEGELCDDANVDEDCDGSTDEGCDTGP